MRISLLCSVFIGHNRGPYISFSSEVFNLGGSNFFVIAALFSALLQPDVADSDVDVRLADEPEIEAAEEAPQEVIEPTQEAEGKCVSRI